MSTGTLNLDPSFRFTQEIPVGSEVRLLYSKSGFVPPDSLNAFHLTDLSAGRLAAIDLLGQISATGIPLLITTQYPSDKGLGNSGQPLKGTSKISDIVGIYAGDDLDNAIKEVKNGE
jgi:hypothetical protein